MSDKDVNINVRAKHTDTTKRDIDGVAASSENLGKKTEQAGKKGAEGTDKLTRSAEKSKGAFGSFMTKIGAWALSLASVAAGIKIVTGVINANKRAIIEHADIAVAQQQKLLRLQFLGDLFKERPELRKEVAAYAEFGKRLPEEVADAWYNLRSKGGALSQQQRDSIMREALEMGRTDLDMPLNTLIDMFTLYAKKTGVEDANRIQNVLRQTITEAGGGGADVAAYMTQFLPLGIATGMTGAESAGLWAYATTEEGSAERATTQLAAVFRGLMGKGTPEGKKILKKAGVTEEMDFFEQLDLLGKEGLSYAEAGQIGEAAGAAMLLSLIQNREAMMEAIGKIVAVDRGDIDLTKTKIQEVMGGDEVARIEEDIRGLDIQLRNIKAADINALRWRKKMREREMSMRRAGRSEYFIGIDRWGYEQAAGLGYSVDWLPSKVEGDPTYTADEQRREREESYHRSRDWWERSFPWIPLRDDPYGEPGKAEAESTPPPAPAESEAEPAITPPPAPADSETEPEITPPPASPDVEADGVIEALWDAFFSAKQARGAALLKVHELAEDRTEAAHKIYATESSTPEKYERNLANWEASFKALDEAWDAYIDADKSDPDVLSDPTLLTPAIIAEIERQTEKLTGSLAPADVEAKPEVTPPPAPAEVEAEAAITPPSAPVEVEAEPAITPPPEPVAVEAEPAITPPPEPVGAEAEGQSVSYNDYSDHYDYSINLFPVAGNREDRLIGPRYDQNA